MIKQATDLDPHTSRDAEVTISGRLLLLRKQRGWTQKRAAAEIKVDHRTYQNWESGKGLSRNATIERIADAFDVDVSYFYNEEEDLENEPVITHQVREIIKREEVCSDVWIMKSGKFFLSGEDEAVRSQMTKLIRERKVRFHFVYTDPVEEIDLPGDAKKSFEIFCQSIKADPDLHDFFAQIEGKSVRDKTTANTLGLSDSWMAFVMAEYNLAGIQKFKKSFDVWIEFMRENKPGESTSGHRGYWIELSQAEARSWRERRMPILSKLPTMSVNEAATSTSS